MDPAVIFVACGLAIAFMIAVAYLTEPEPRAPRRPYRCPLCGYASSEPEEVIEHMRSEHQ